MLCYMHNYIESSAPLKKPRDFKLWYWVGLNIESDVKYRIGPRNVESDVESDMKSAE